MGLHGHSVKKCCNGVCRKGLGARDGGGGIGCSLNIMRIGEHALWTEEHYFVSQREPYRPLITQILHFLGGNICQHAVIGNFGNNSLMEYLASGLCHKRSYRS